MVKVIGWFMSFIKSFHFLFLFLFYLDSCHPMRSQQPGDDYLPDLKIQNVRYAFIRQDITTKKNEPKMTIMSPIIDLEFYIMIENIGTADWEDDLCIYYNLDTGWEQDIIRIEALQIPYALNAEVSFILMNLTRRPKTATIILNPADTDSAAGCIFVKEAFYNNNIYQINFDN